MTDSGKQSRWNQRSKVGMIKLDMHMADGRDTEVQRTYMAQPPVYSMHALMTGCTLQRKVCIDQETNTSFIVTMPRIERQVVASAMSSGAALVGASGGVQRGQYFVGQ
jgi:hypothetical protein